MNLMQIKYNAHSVTIILHTISKCNGLVIIKSNNKSIYCLFVLQQHTDHSTMENSLSSTMPKEDGYSIGFTAKFNL